MKRLMLSATMLALACAAGNADAKAVKRSSVCIDDTRALCAGINGLGAQEACLAKNLSKLSPACRVKIERKG